MRLATDHKAIGVRFLVFGLVMLLVGGLFALLIRWALAFPDAPVPGFGWVPQPFLFDGIIPVTTYNQLFTLHGTVMLFFAVTPILVGGFGTYLVPLMIGARDMAVPALSAASFWGTVAGAAVLLASFGVEAGPANTGWTAYPPLAAVPSLTAVERGQDLWCISILLLATAQILGAANLVATVVARRAPGMAWLRLPLTVWAMFLTSVLVLLAFPVLAVALGMLLADRTLGTHFFLPDGGGEPLLWQHLFWFFGHPEVYVLILPAMGVVSDVIAVFARKPVFGYGAMVTCMSAIALLSFLVWGHHMFQSGMSPALGTTFMLSSMAIAVPSAVETFGWLATLWGGRLRLRTPMWFALGFISLFVVGGLSGIFLASTPVDMYVHDTYFVVAHIHYVIVGGSLFGAFAALYYWFPKMSGRMLDERLGRVHFWATYVAFNLTIFPMHLLGLAGHVRRIAEPMKYEFLAPLQPVNRFVTWSALALAAAQLPFLANLAWSLVRGVPAPANPWDAATLEWSAPSPPPPGNFPGALPVVARGPYEYAAPGAADWLPQAHAVGGVA